MSKVVKGEVCYFCISSGIKCNCTNKLVGKLVKAPQCSGSSNGLLLYDFVYLFLPIFQTEPIAWTRKTTKTVLAMQRRGRNSTNSFFPHLLLWKTITSLFELMSKHTGVPLAHIISLSHSSASIHSQFIICDNCFTYSQS